MRRTALQGSFKLEVQLGKLSDSEIKPGQAEQDEQATLMSMLHSC